MMAARLLISSQVVAFQLAVRAQDYEDDVNVAYLADLKPRGDALTAAPSLELGARFLVRQVFEEPESEELPGRLEAAVDSDGGSERCQSLVRPMSLRISSEPSTFTASL
jgi:hypothetical protein